MQTLIGMFFGALMGWWVAHDIVSSECEKIGMFYVGNKVFICVLKQDINDNAGSEQGE